MSAVCLKKRSCWRYVQ